MKLSTVFMFMEKYEFCDQDGNAHYVDMVYDKKNGVYRVVADGELYATRGNWSEAVGDGADFIIENNLRNYM